MQKARAKRVQQALERIEGRRDLGIRSPTIEDAVDDPWDISTVNSFRHTLKTILSHF